MQYINGTLCFIDALHLNETKAFGALVVTVDHNLCADNRSGPTEEFLKVAFRGVKREVADIEPRGCHLDEFGRTAFPRLAFASLASFFTLTGGLVGC